MAERKIPDLTKKPSVKKPTLPKWAIRTFFIVLILIGITTILPSCEDVMKQSGNTSTPKTTSAPQYELSWVKPPEVAGNVPQQREAKIPVTVIRNDEFVFEIVYSYRHEGKSGKGRMFWDKTRSAYGEYTLSNHPELGTGEWYLKPDPSSVHGVQWVGGIRNSNSKGAWSTLILKQTN